MLTRSITVGQFWDVSDYDWYGESVAIAYEFGLANGVGNHFGVNDTLSVAQALAFSCRLHKIYNASRESFDESRGIKWYNTYQGYGITYELIKDGEFGSEDMERPVTRAEYAELLSRAFPRDAFPVTLGTEKTSLPDVPAESAHSGAILMLYNAGVVTGMDDAGNFSPDSPITRAAAVTIIARMAQPQSRIRPNAAEQASDAAVSGAPVFTYLVKTALANGAENSSGNIRYRYGRVFKDNFTYSFLLYYCPELLDGKDYITLDIGAVQDDSDSSLYCEIYIPSDLSKPYISTCHMEIATDESDEPYSFMGYLTLNPEVFTGKEEALTLFDFEQDGGARTLSEDDLSAIQEVIEEKVPDYFDLSLAAAQQELLSDGGFTLADLGFTRLGTSGGGQEVTGVKLNSSARTVSVGESFTLLADVSPSDAANPSVTWRSSDASVARVDSNGQVTGVGAGTATVTAATSNGKTASCTVTVTAASSNLDVMSFLKELVITNGKQDSDGDYYYDYKPSSSYDGSDYTVRFYCYYMPEDDTVDVYCKATFDDGNIHFCLVELYNDPNNESRCYMNFIRKSDGEYYTGKLLLDRATFSGSGADPEFDSFDHDGEAGVEKMMRENVNTMARLALKVAEENLLTPNGYSLRDLGFLNLD